MVEFVKEILNNNTLMILLMFIVIFSISVFAFSQVRKAILGSLISGAVSLSIALISKIDSINEFYNLVFRDMFVFLRYRAASSSSYERNLCFYYITLERDINLSLFDLIDFANDSKIIVSYSLNIVREFKIKLVSFLSNKKNNMIGKINMSKYTFALRLWFVLLFKIYIREGENKKWVA